MDELVNTHLTGNFSIDCTTITVRQREGGENYYFSGPGTIYSDDKKILFKMFPVKEASTNLSVKDAFSINFDYGTVAGQVLPENYYYDLEATPLKGAHWRSERFHPHFDISFAGDGMVITGALRRLTGSDLPPGCINGKLINIYYRNKVEFPCNTMTKQEKLVGSHRRSESMAWDVSQFTANNFEFEIRQEESGTVVSAYSKDGNMQDNLATRISEAMSFAFGEEFSAAAVTLGSKDGGVVELHRGHHERRGSARPPYPCRFHDPIDSFWKVFISYFEYVLPHPGESLHPVTSQILAVHRSESGSIDAQALSLALAVEGISKYGYKNFGAPTDGEKELIEKAILVISNSEINENLKPRIIGAASNMKYARADDRLTSAAKSGIIRDSLIPVWKRLRNSHAHAKLLDIEKIQKTIDDCNAVRTLMHELVFGLIKYKGYYSDYSVPGWPVREYP
jgi:hypothetical protein